jgi:hypothetical protein
MGNRKLYMPKGIATWLKGNTKLTDEQIAVFCGLDQFYVQNILDAGTHEHDPVSEGILSEEIIIECEKDPTKHLKIQESVLKYSKYQKEIKPRVSLYKRKQIPGIVAWLLNKYPNITSDQIFEIVGYSKVIIQNSFKKIKSKKEFFEPVNPVKNSICREDKIEKILKGG